MCADRSSVAFAESLPTHGTAPGFRPGGRVTFLCLAREKSPKERRLTAHQAARATTHAREVMREACPDANRCALAAVPIPSTIHRTFTPVNAACTASSPLKAPHASTRRPGGACIATREFGVQPTLSARAFDASGSSQGQPRERSGSLLCASRALVFARFPSQASRSVRFSASSLVTFFWRDRRKLPALAGRIPAAVHRVERLPAKAPIQATPRPSTAPGH